MKMTNFFGKILFVWIIMSSQATFAQDPLGQAAALQNVPKGKVVMAWYSAWVNKDWNSMVQILADGFTFSSPLNDHINVKSFKEVCWPNTYKIKRFDVVKFAVNGNHVFVISDGWTTEGKLARNTDYFLIIDGKIKAYECYFGPGINYPLSGK
ncbi:MAG TPA: nuclear transport factor 2 family protein [Chitinophagaceae bacterium]